MNKTLIHLALTLLVFPLIFFTSGVLTSQQVAHADDLGLANPSNPVYNQGSNNLKSCLNPTNPANTTNPANPISPFNPDNTSSNEDSNKTTPRFSHQEQVIITVVVIGMILILIFAILASVILI